MRVVVFGAGGLGSLLGGYLALAGAEVTLVARPAHARAIRENGLLIRGIRGEFHITQNLTAVERPEEAKGVYDWFFLGVKAKDTLKALEEARPLRERVKAALSLQNSVEKDGILASYFGAEKVVGFATIEGARLAEPGVVENTLTVPTTNYIGELDGRPSSRVEALAQRFNQVGLGTRVVENIQKVEWEKLAQICLASSWAVSTLSGHPGLRFADGLVVREGAEHFVALAKDILEVFAALGYEPENLFAPVSRLKELRELAFPEAAAMVQKMGEELRARGSRATTSMHEDVLRGRKTEVEFILGPFVREGMRRGLSIPTLLAAYRIIKTLDAYLT
jgi:2-dehydropantoate 2-reductase